MKKNKFIIVLFVISVVLVLLFPQIHDFIEDFKLPKINNNKVKEEVKKKVVDEEILSNLHYPLMRNGVYSATTYYSLDKFTYSDMSNNDILYNAFLDIYEGNMTPYEGVTNCTNISKQFQDDYIKLRIKNIIGKSVNYNLADFIVEEGNDSPYIGTWQYDAVNSRFIYTGLCNTGDTSVKYYDLTEFIKASYDNDDIVVYNYVGFAKVIDNMYYIYSDASMQNEISTGNFINVEDLNSKFKNINKKSKKVYKYTFKDTLCSYNEYCLYEGKWVNEF